MSSSKNDERGLFEENNNRLLVLPEFGFKWISTLDLLTETFFFSAVRCSRVFCLNLSNMRAIAFSTKSGISTGFWADERCSSDSSIEATLTLSFSTSCSTP